LEAGYQGDIDPLTESVGLTSHAMALGQHAATTPIRRRAERKREARRRADAEAAAAGRPTEEPAASEAELPAAGPTETEAGALKPALTAEAPLAAPPGGPSEQKPRPPVAGDTSTAPKPLRGGEGAAPAPPARPPGGPTDPIAAGVIPEGSAKTLQQLADEYDLVIKVRPMNPESIARLEPRRDGAGAIVEDAALPKPDIVKAKSINELDEYIGGPVNSRGLVGLFEPRPPSADLPPDLLAAATDRYQRRLEEWRTRDADYGRYQRDGILRIEGGLVQVVDPRLSSDSGADPGRFRNVAGDIDVYDITHADGSPLTDRQRNDLTVLLRSMGIGVEHGAHEWWRTQHPGSFKTEAYEGIRQEHLQKTPLIAFLPVAQPQSVWADSVVRTTPREDRPGQRIRPLREQAGEQFSLVPREEAGRTSPDTPDTPGHSPAGSAGETVSTPRPGPAEGGAGGGSTPSSPSPSGGGTRPTAGGPGTSQPLLRAGAGSPSPGVGAEPFAATPVAPDPLAQTPRETLTQAEPETPTLISQANLFRSGDARVPEGLAPAVEHITWDQWAHIETVGEGNNLKYILVDATTGERWMFKPAGGEEGMAFGPDLGIETGERWRRALAAAYLSQDLGLETPYVRLVEIDGMVGSLQEWRAGFEARSTIPGPAQANFDAFWNSRFRHDIDAFDYFIANQDRHERNVMIRMEGGRPRRLLIDQDAGMPPSPERFTAARPRDQLGRWQRDLPPSVSAEVAQRFRELAERFPDAQLRQWLTDAEVDGLWSRLNEVVDDLDSGRIGIVED
ncbi:MAG TPA: hypothetical protein VMP67_09315, partial [Candidatus Limnocylindria bacterium]|nr:hypothetical protein [Candidatus Limnocylindria bacterium]